MLAAFSTGEATQAQQLPPLTIILIGGAEFCADELLKRRHMTLPLSALLGDTDRW
jgi:hypothetical protein